MRVILMNMNKILLILISTAIMISCGSNDRIVLKAINEQASLHHADGGSLIDFKQLPFHWDTLYIFDDQHRRSEIENIIGNPIDYDLSDPGTHMFFLKGGCLVYEEHWLDTECFNSKFELNLKFPYISICSDYLCIVRSNSVFMLNPNNELSLNERLGNNK